MIYRPITGPTRRRITYRINLALALLLGLALPACLAPVRAQVQAPATVPAAVATRWDHRPEATAWTTAMMEALQTDGAAMLAMVPEDVQDYCPGYTTATPAQRAAFYVAFFSGLARFESTWNPRASGAGGRYRGLLQISPGTARAHDCALGDGGLYDGATNLACAVRVANAAITRDGVLTRASGGIAADWPPLRTPSRRAEIAAFTRGLPQCAHGT